jgi:hypothetical protein
LIKLSECSRIFAVILTFGIISNKTPDIGGTPEAEDMNAAYESLRELSLSSLNAFCELKEFPLSSIGTLGGLEKMLASSTSAVECLLGKVSILEIESFGLAAPCGEVAWSRGVW